MTLWCDLHTLEDGDTVSSMSVDWPVVLLMICLSVVVVVHLFCYLLFNQSASMQ